MNNFNDLPCACGDLLSFRYRGRYGWIMIGATDAADALREAARSTDDEINPNNLQAWNGEKYA